MLEQPNRVLLKTPRMQLQQVKTDLSGRPCGPRNWCGHLLAVIRWLANFLGKAVRCSIHLRELHERLDRPSWRDQKRESKESNVWPMWAK